MTPDELKKEAERVITEMGCDSCQSSSNMRKMMTASVLDALRAVHNAAIEKAAELFEQSCHCAEQGFDCEHGDPPASRIRALRIGDGK